MNNEVFMRSRVHIEVLPGCHIKQAFKDMATLRDAGFADEKTTITMNGITFCAGLFETVDEFMKYFDAVMSGNKQSVIDSIPMKIGCSNAFDCAAKILRDRGVETFSIDELKRFYDIEESLIMNNSERKYC